MNLFIKKTLIYAFSTMIFIVLINILSDPANLLSTKVEEEISTYISDGHNVTYSTNINERLLQKLLIEKIAKSPDTIILGSSRIMLVGQKYYGPKTFNSGVSGASLEDIIAIYNIYLSYGKMPSKVVIGIDPWIFNDNNKQERWKSIREYYNSFNDKNYQKPFSSISFYNFRQFFSITYFQSSIINLIKKRQNLFKPIAVTPTSNDINNNFTKKVDGTITYDKNYRDVTTDTINEKARNYINGEIYGLNDFNQLSSKLMQEFEKFVIFLQSNDVEVQLLLIPYHPMVYNYLEDNISIINEVEAHIRNFSEDNALEIFGSYNPNKYKIIQNDFYDGMHLKETGVDKILPVY